MQLVFEGVGFSYKAAEEGQAPALSNIDFAIEPGECLAIAGHTGSGKSTLVQLFNGLLKPTAGRVLFDGRDMTDLDVRSEARRHIGLVFQYPERQLFASTVLEDVMFGPRNLGFSERKAKQAAVAALKRVSLDVDEVGNLSPFHLSGGQQRRVAFAGVLAMEPELIVFDEPTAGLDPATHESFVHLLVELRESGTTCVITSHDMNDIGRLATRMMVLDQGRIAMLDTPHAVFSRVDELAAISLDIPQVQRFAMQLREKGLPLPDALYTEESLADAIAKALASRA